MKTTPWRFTLPALPAFALLTLSGAAWPQGTDYSKVQITTTKVAANFYTLDGSGGKIGVLSGPDGVLMVDSQFAPLTDKIVAAVKQITSSPIRFLIDTHVHGDHTGGNENLGKLGATIFAREELRDRLTRSGTAPVGLPVVTYTGKLTFHLNGERVELIPVPAAPKLARRDWRLPGTVTRQLVSFNPKSPFCQTIRNLSDDQRKPVRSNECPVRQHLENSQCFAVAEVNDWRAFMIPAAPVETGAFAVA